MRTARDMVVVGISEGVVGMLLERTTRGKTRWWDTLISGEARRAVTVRGPVTMLAVLVLVTEVGVARAGKTWSRSVGLSNRKCGGGAGGSRSAPSIFLKNPTNESGGILREFVEINGLNESVPRFRKGRKEV